MQLCLYAVHRFKTRTPVYIDRMVPYNHFRILPFMQVLETVASHDDTEFMFGMFLGQPGQGVYCIRGFGQVELNIGGPDPVIVFRGHPYQVETVKFIEQAGFLFEWVLRRYHKPDLFNIRFVQYMVGNDEVGDMHRVERTEIQANFHLKY